MNIASKTINSQIDAIEQLPFTLAADEYLCDFLSSPFNPLDANTVRKHLTQYVCTSPIIENVLVMGDGHGFVCGSKGIFLKENSILTILLDGNPISNLFSIRLNNLKESRQKTYTVLDPEDVLVCTRRMYLERTNSMSTVIILIDAMKLKSLLGVTEDSGYSYLEHVALFSDSKDLIIQLTSNAEVTLPPEELKKLDLLSGGLFETRYDGKEYIVICDTVGSLDDYRTVAVIPRGRIADILSRSIRMILVQFILLIFLLALIVYILVHRSYNAMNELRSASQAAMTQIEERYSFDDVTQVKDIITNMANRVNVLQTRLASMEPLQRQQLVCQLVNQGSEDRVDQLLEKAGVCFEYPYYSVIVILLNADAEQSAFSDFLKTYAAEDMILLCSGIIAPRDNVIVICNHALDQRGLWLFWTEFEHQWRDLTGVPLCIGIGSIHNRVEVLGEAYIEAKSALDYRLVYGESIIAHWDLKPLDASQTASLRSLSSFGDIYQAIVNVNTAKIQEILNQFSAYLTEAHLPLSYVKGLCYELISNVIKAVNELTSTDALSENSVDIIQLGQFETVDQLVSIVTDVAHNLKELLGNNRADTDEHLIEAMLDYCQKHYTDADFSLQGVANEFSMSLSAFSQFFKQKMGVTAISYIADLRISYARRLLEETDLSVTDICTQVGYFSSSGFIRKFRQMENCTPTEYRTRARLKKKYGGAGS